jgi:hypothetical protein
MDHFLAREIGRQWTARRFRFRFDGFADRRNASQPLRIVFFERLDREFELLDGSIDLLR